MPPSAIVSVPVPSLPMFTPELLVHVEPAPVTVTVPREPANSPMLAVLGVSLMTVPPFAIVSVPVPKAPTLSPPLGPLIQVEPGPVTVTAPIEPTVNPTEAPAPLFTVPWSLIIRVPVPSPPITTPPAFDQLEFNPVTVTVPTPPGKSPTVPKESANVPPCWIASIPVPSTDKFRALPPGVSTTVGCSDSVSMLALVPAVGTPAVQLPGINQSEEVAPVQSVWACAETIDAAKSTLIASNLAVRCVASWNPRRARRIMAGPPMRAEPRVLRSSSKAPRFGES